MRLPFLAIVLVVVAAAAAAAAAAAGVSPLDTCNAFCDRERAPESWHMGAKTGDRACHGRGPQSPCRHGCLADPGKVDFAVEPLAAGAFASAPCEAECASFSAVGQRQQVGGTTFVDYSDQQCCQRGCTVLGFYHARAVPRAFTQADRTACSSYCVAVFSQHWMASTCANVCQAARDLSGIAVMPAYFAAPGQARQKLRASAMASAFLWGRLVDARQLVTSLGLPRRSCEMACHGALISWDWDGAGDAANAFQAAEKDACTGACRELGPTSAGDPRLGSRSWYAFPTPSADELGLAVNSAYLAGAGFKVSSGPARPEPWARTG